jgi:hypothetical protein
VAENIAPHALPGGVGSFSWSLMRSPEIACPGCAKIDDLNVPADAGWTIVRAQALVPISPWCLDERILEASRSYQHHASCIE